MLSLPNWFAATTRCWRSFTLGIVVRALATAAALTTPALAQDDVSPTPVAAAKSADLPSWLASTTINGFVDSYASSVRSEIYRQCNDPGTPLP